MGSNFNLGSIPEDMSMDTADLDTTLTAESNNVVGQTTTTLVGPGAANCTAAVNGNPAPNDQLISSVLPAHAEIPTLGDDNDIMLNDMNDILNQRPENEPVTHWL